MPNMNEIVARNPGDSGKHITYINSICGQAGRRAGGQAGRRAGGQAGRRAGGMLKTTFYQEGILKTCTFFEVSR
jgi:hypothetical protein